MLNLPHQNRVCISTKPAFSFWINISTFSEIRCDCQGLGLVARIEASILVFDTKQVLYWPVLRQIQFCSFDRGCKSCLDTKPVLYQGRFCSLTHSGLQNGMLAWCFFYLLQQYRWHRWIRNRWDSHIAHIRFSHLCLVICLWQSRRRRMIDLHVNIYTVAHKVCICFVSCCYCRS